MGLGSSILFLIFSLYLWKMSEVQIGYIRRHKNKCYLNKFYLKLSHSGTTYDDLENKAYKEREE